MDIAKWHNISAPTPWEKDDLRHFSRMQISAHNSLCKRSETTTYERVMRAAVIHTCPRHLSVSRDPVGKKAKTRLCNLPPPTGTEQSVLTRAYTLHLPLGSLPPPSSPLKYVNVAKRALRALEWWPTRSMTWTTTWQSSADCRSGQLPVIYDSKPSSSPIKIKDSDFPQQSDSTGPSAR